MASFINGCSYSSTDSNIDPNAPAVFSTTPADGEDNVIRNTVVEITFDQAMNPTTINMMQESTSVSGSLDYSGTVAMFKPDNVLAAQTEYTVTTTAVSSASIALPNAYTFSFTTGAPLNNSSP